MAELFTSSYYLHLFTTFSSDEKGFFMIGFNVRGDPVNKAPIIVYILRSSEKLNISVIFNLSLPYWFNDHWVIGKTFKIYS